MAELQAELAKLRAATDAELARQRAAFEKDLQSAGRKSVSLREEQKQLARMQEALEEADGRRCGVHLRGLVQCFVLSHVLWRPAAAGATAASTATEAAASFLPRAFLPLVAAPPREGRRRRSWGG